MYENPIKKKKKETVISGTSMKTVRMRMEQGEPYVCEKEIRSHISQE